MNRRQFIKGMIATSVLLSIPKILQPEIEQDIIINGFDFCEHYKSGDTLLISSGSTEEYFTIKNVSIDKREITINVI